MARPKGQPKLGGRKKGTPNKANASVKDALEFAYGDIGGHVAFSKWAKENSGDFYRLWVKMLPPPTLPELPDNDRRAIATDVLGQLAALLAGRIVDPRSGGGAA